MLGGVRVFIAKARYVTYVMMRFCLPTGLDQSISNLYRNQSALEQKSRFVSISPQDAGKHPIVVVDREDQAST